MQVKIQNYLFNAKIIYDFINQFLLQNFNSRIMDLQFQKMQNLIERRSYQQQFAAIFALLVWHFTQTSSVSLHESRQRGIQQRPAVLRHRHHKIATKPTFLRGIVPVSVPQLMQLLEFPRLLFCFWMTMVWGCGGGGGGAGWQMGGGGAIIMGGGAIIMGG